MGKLPGVVNVRRHWNAGLITDPPSLFSHFFDVFQSMLRRILAGHRVSHCVPIHLMLIMTGFAALPFTTNSTETSPLPFIVGKSLRLT